MSEETDPAGKYRLRSLEEILAPYADPETWREQLDEVQNLELRAVFEKRLESMEGVTDTSQEAPIKHMLAPMTAAEIASAKGQDSAVTKPVPRPRVQPYSEEQILACAQVIARVLTPLEIWLFGSAASGDGNEGSDVDLLVVLQDDHKFERPTYEAVLALSRARAFVPTCVIVITESQKRDPTPLVEDALREGRRLLWGGACGQRPSAEFTGECRLTVMLSSLPPDLLWQGCLFGTAKI
ncbi:MAG: polymerase beta, Nucleotidyltransferase [Verrucomicrobiota bacterium]|jgi:hypothetical protein